MFQKMVDINTNLSDFKKNDQQRWHPRWGDGTEMGIEKDYKYHAISYRMSF